MRLKTLAIAALVSGLLPAVAAAESYTTRIEPRAAYGASVTMEHGVRVIRPLPPTRHVIVNPGGKTPLALSFNDTRVVEHSTSTNYHYDQGGGSGGGGYVGGIGGFGHGGFKKHHGHGGKPGGVPAFGRGHGRGGHGHGGHR